MKKTKVKKQEKQNKEETGANADDSKLPKHMGLKFIVLQIAMISFGLFLYFVLASYKAGTEKEYILTNQPDKIQSTSSQNSQGTDQGLSPFSQEEYLARRNQAYETLQKEAENNEWFAKHYNQVHDSSVGIKKIYGANCDFFDFIGKKLDLDALIDTQRPFEVVTPEDEDPPNTISGRIIIYTDQNAIVKAIRCE